MKNLICLVLVFLFILAIVPKSQACVVEPVTATTTVVIVGVGGGGGGMAIGFIYPILIELGVLAAFSPYFIIYYNHPECRQEKDIGSMSECYKKSESK